MILTNCAACAAPLAHDAPRCVRCQVRYCSAREADEASLEKLKAMLAESDDVDEEEDAWAADLEEELSA